MNVLGVMSGSSLDGIDLAIVSFENGDWRLIHCDHAMIPEPLADELKSYHHLGARDYLSLASRYDYFLGSTIKAYLTSIDFEVDLIGLHGHTIIHIPDQNMTVQLGNGGAISAMAEVDVVSDFRIQDVVKNGKGTPLVSIADRDLFPGYEYYLNLGGIANITKLKEDTIAAYDICPCNQLLNHFSQLYFDIPYDHNGDRARSGKYDASITEKIDTLPYWAMPSPKSLDNNWIKEEVLPAINHNRKEKVDVLHSLTVWIADKIANEFSTGPAKVLVTGGGAYHSFLIEKITSFAKPKGVEICIPDKEIIDYKESILMAYLAYNRVHNQSNILAQVTGAQSDTIAGAYYKY